MTSVLKPGILVSLKTRLMGGVRYQRTDLAVEEVKALEDAGAEVPEALREKARSAISRWETTKEIENVDEHKAATQARSKAASAIRAICTATSFGLLCPEGREAELDQAVTAARNLVDLHNRAAQHTRVDVYVLKGRIASSDEEAARAIASEVTDLLRQMEEGIRNVDVEAIREAAAKAKKMGAVLGDEQSQKLLEASEAARKAAREIVRRVEKGGEAAEVVLGQLDVSAISGARFAFLDLESSSEGAVTGATPAVSLQRVAGLDVEPADEPEEPAAFCGPPEQLQVFSNRFDLDLEMGEV